MTTRIVLLHGLGDDQSAWDAVSPGLGRSGGPRLLTLPGFGGTPAPRPVPAENIAAEVWDRIDDAGPVVLVGHSAGGVIATLMAESRPERVAALVNVEGNLSGDDCTFSAEAVAADPFDPWFASFVHRQSGRYAEALRRCEPAAFRSLAADLVRLSEDAQLGARYVALAMPKLFCLGATYSMSSQQLLRDAGEHIADFGDAGHWIMDDQPAAFVDSLDEFLSGFD